MKMRKTLLTLAFAALTFGLGAVVNNEIVIPDVDGFKTLKGDMHLHTVFSDGRVWPTTRVDEALWEGLDFIAMTDHVDTRLQRQIKAGYFNPEKAGRNSSYEIAKKYAGKRLLIIPGGEISRGMPPGHFNVYFIDDADAICKAAEANDNDHMKAMEGGLDEALRQGGFTQWNHPNWEKQAPNGAVIWPEHNKIREQGKMMGIEIYNQFSGYCPEAHRYALDHGLTVTAGSDAHYPFFQLVDYKNGQHRPLTLIFSKDKSLEGLREALNNHRTAVIAEEIVYGDEANLRPLFEAMVTVSDLKISDSKVSFILRNNSTVPVRFRKGKGSENYYYSPDFELRPFEQKSITVSPLLVGNRPGIIKDDVIDVNYTIDNFMTAPGSPLAVRWSFRKE